MSMYLWPIVGGTILSAQTTVPYNIDHSSWNAVYIDHLSIDRAPGDEGPSLVIFCCMVFSPFAGRDPARSMVLAVGIDPTPAYMALPVQHQHLAAGCQDNADAAGQPRKCAGSQFTTHNIRVM